MKTITYELWIKRDNIVFKASVCTREEFGNLECITLDELKAIKKKGDQLIKVTKEPV